MARYLKAFAAITTYLILADIAGFILCFVVDVLPLRFASTALFYAVWFVAGVFGGLFAYEAGGKRLMTTDPVDDADAVRQGLVVLGMTVLITIGVSILLFKFMWKGGVDSDPYVPDNMPMTLLFFAATVGSMILGHTVLRPSKTDGSKGSASSSL